MNVLVYNLAAEYAGAMTILENFYREAATYEDKSIHWYFLVSTDKLQDTDNITVITKPWVKKSWLHRLWFDTFLVQKVVKEKQIDVVFSMQNAAVKRTKAKQVVYFHQSLQFSPVKFSLWDKGQREYALRQKFVCRLYRRGLKKADHIIVQTQWFKEASAKWIPFDENKFSVVNPEVSIDEAHLQMPFQLTEPLFFYPAGDGVHKNHALVLRACELLKAQGIDGYKVVFTMDGKSPFSAKIAAEAEEKGLPIQFVGILPKNEVLDYYSRSVLLFPTYLETFGLPPKEARMMKGIVLASDMPFCHESLAGYENAHFFGIHDAEKLASLMRSVIQGELAYVQPQEVLQTEGKKRVIDCIFDGIQTEKGK